jgi:hypothetical protein
MAHLTPETFENPSPNKLVRSDLRHQRAFREATAPQAKERNYRALRAGAALLAAFGIYEGVTHFPNMNPQIVKHTQTIQEQGLNGPDDIGYKVVTTESSK